MGNAPSVNPTSTSSPLSSSPLTPLPLVVVPASSLQASGKLQPLPMIHTPQPLSNMPSVDAPLGTADRLRSRSPKSSPQTSPKSSPKVSPQTSPRAHRGQLTPATGLFASQPLATLEPTNNSTLHTTISDPGRILPPVTTMTREQYQQYLQENSTQADIYIDEWIKTRMPIPELHARLEADGYTDFEEALELAATYGNAQAADYFIGMGATNLREAADWAAFWHHDALAARLRGLYDKKKAKPHRRRVNG